MSKLDELALQKVGFFAADALEWLGKHCQKHPRDDEAFALYSKGVRAFAAIHAARTAADGDTVPHDATKAR